MTMSRNRTINHFKVKESKERVKEVNRVKELKITQEVRVKNIKKRYTEIVAEYISKGYLLRLENKRQRNELHYALSSIELEKGGKVICLFLVNEYSNNNNYTILKELTVKTNKQKELSYIETENNLAIIEVWKGV